MDRLPWLLAETPRAGQWHHRFLVPTGCGLSEDTVQRFVQAACRTNGEQLSGGEPIPNIGGNYVGLVRAVLQPTSGRYGRETLVLAGVDWEGLSEEQQERVRRFLTQGLGKLEEVVLRVDWDAAGTTTVVERGELTDWVREAFPAGLPLHEEREKPVRFPPPRPRRRLRGLLVVLLALVLLGAAVLGVVHWLWPTRTAKDSQAAVIPILPPPSAQATDVMPTDPDKALEQLLRTLGVREAPERQRGKEELRRLGGDNKQFLAKVWKDKAVDPLYFVPQRYQSALQHDFQVHSFPWDEVVEARRLRHIRQTLADVAPRLHALHRTLVSVRQDLEVIPSENQDQYLEALKDLANDRYAPPQPESKEGMGKPLLPFFSEQDGLVADQLRFLVGTSRFSRFLPDGPAPKTLPLLVRALGKNPKDLKRARQDEFDRVQTRVGDDRLRGVLVKAYRDLEEFLVDLGKAGNDLAPP